jgi:hypothetical protein
MVPLGGVSDGPPAPGAGRRGDDRMKTPDPHPDVSTRLGRDGPDGEAHRRREA